MKRRIIVCNTHYQLLVAVHMKLTVFKEDSVDCILTDCISNAESIVLNLQNSNVFEHVTLCMVRRLKIDGRSKYIMEKNFKKLVPAGFLKLLNGKNRYQEMLFANMGGFSVQLGRYLLKFNPDIQFSMYEDGLSSYSGIYREFYNQLTNSGGIKYIIKKMLRYNIVALVNAYYVFCPELMVWENPFTKKLPPIEVDREELRDILNYVYKYNELEDSYSERVIFFEESNDLAIVDKLADAYGKDNIFIKRHPRNEINRFENLMYKTNINKSIPWELIALNIDLNNKVLVTMTSSSVANTFLLFNSKAKIVFDYSSLDICANERIKYTVEVIENMKKLYPEMLGDC